MDYQFTQNIGARIDTSRSGLSANEVSRIVQSQVKQGEVIKGSSRIEYIPYEKKYTDYEVRQRVQRVPKVRKVIEYEERRVIEEVPREVVKTDYYAVESITQYHKQIIPEKKVQMIPVQRKVKRIEYIPVQKQIVHYPENQNEDYAKGQSRIILQNQGVNIRPDAQYRRIDPRLIYQYSSQHHMNPIGYVQDGFERNLSTAPTHYRNNTKNELMYSTPYNYQQFPSKQTLINQFDPYQRSTYISQSQIQNNSSFAPRVDNQVMENSQVHKFSQTSTTVNPN